MSRMSLLFRLMTSILGIDIGTTNTCFAMLRKTADKTRKVEVVEFNDGKLISPSMVTFTEDGEVLIGNESKQLMSSCPGNTLYNARRLLGVKYDEISDDLKNAGYKLVKDSMSGDTLYEITVKNKKRLVAPEEVIAFILAKAKLQVKAKTGSDSVEAIITVPSYFNDKQREAMKNAAKIAGINVIRIISEPTAVVAAYANELGLSKGRVFVFGFGVNTIDTSIIDIDGNRYTFRGVSGCQHGREDIDNLFVDYVLKKFRKQTRTTESIGERGMATLRQRCEEARTILTFNEKADILIPNFCEGRDLNVRIFQAEFNSIMSDLLEEIKELVMETLSDVRIEAEEITHLIVVGDSAQGKIIPAVVETVSSCFDDRLTPMTGIHPEYAVAIGACHIGVSISESKNMNK